MSISDEMIKTRLSRDRVVNNFLTDNLARWAFTVQWIKEKLFAYGSSNNNLNATIFIALSYSHIIVSGCVFIVNKNVSSSPLYSSFLTLESFHLTQHSSRIHYQNPGITWVFFLLSLFKPRYCFGDFHGKFCFILRESPLMRIEFNSEKNINS